MGACVISHLSDDDKTDTPTHTHLHTHKRTFGHTDTHNQTNIPFVRTCASEKALTNSLRGQQLSLTCTSNKQFEPQSIIFIIRPKDATV